MIDCFSRLFSDVWVHHRVFNTVSETVHLQIDKETKLIKERFPFLLPPNVNFQSHSHEERKAQLLNHYNTIQPTLLAFDKCLVNHNFNWSRVTKRCIFTNVPSANLVQCKTTFIFNYKIRQETCILTLLMKPLSHSSLKFRTCEMIPYDILNPS